MSALGQKQTWATHFDGWREPFLLFYSIAAAKEATDRRARPYPERHTHQYGQPQYPTVKLWAEPYYENEHNKK
jgi:hypothetical protein